MTTLTRNTTHPLRWISEPVFSVPIEEGIQNVDGGFRLMSTRCFHVRALLGVCSPSAAVEKQKNSQVLWTRACVILRVILLYKDVFITCRHPVTYCSYVVERGAGLRQQY